MTRIIQLRGGGAEQRLVITDLGDLNAVEFVVEQKVDDGWNRMRSFRLDVPSATHLGDVCAAFVALWEERRSAEILQRTGGA